ncbi:serine/threonine-protein kinase [Granulosicoccaceae sp. 1_MG-2023]|nr:serine/threonine-protein kinase [Granulosicoccaceae sp. 1_MG-2023]
MPKSAELDQAANDSRDNEAAQQSAAAASAGAESSAKNPAERSDKPLKALDFDVPERVGKYVLGDKLGSGTCGVVYKARDEVLNRIVAIKLSPIGKPDVSTGQVPGAQRAFMTEISAAGRLKHPNVVTVYDAGQQDDLNFLVMEYVAGHSLKAVGKGQKLLPPHRAIEVIMECCKALDYAHSRGIIHRDIKPANIMMGRDGTVKLLDFGIAVKTTGDDATAVGPTLGTPNYMSPEQIRGKNLGPASDLYSLATVLFELLTGKQLFKAKKVKELFRIVVGEIAPKLNDIRPDLPIELSEIIARALNKMPDQRYQSGEAFAEALRPLAEQLRIMAHRSEHQRSFIQRLRRLSFFQEFNDGEVAVFLNHAEQRDFYDGDLLIGEGVKTREFSVITRGVVLVRRNGVLQRVLGEGDTFGEFGFIHDEPSPVQVSALRGVSVLTVSPAFLGELSPKTHLHYYKRISESLVHKMAVGDVLTPDLLLEDA